MRNFVILFTDLRRAWRLLGGNELGTLAVRKLGTILRGFGKNPTEQEVDYLKYEHGLNGINRLFAYCKGSNFNIHIWAWLLNKGNQVLFIIW